MDVTGLFGVEAIITPVVSPNARGGMEKAFVPACVHTHRHGWRWASRGA